MKKPYLMLTAISCLLAAFFLTACGNQPSPEPTEAPESAPVASNLPEESSTVSGGFYSFDSMAGIPGGQEWNDTAVEKNAAARAKYTASRTTLENGVVVQSVPDDYLLYNLAVLNAEERGCNSCHSLSDAVQCLPLSHPILENWFPRGEITVDQCIVCHVYLDYYGVNLAESMHSLHMNSTSFNAMNGNCLSCHEIDSEGNYVMWDHVKFDVMHGITTVSADDVLADVSYTQDKITESEYMYQYWENSNGSGIVDAFGDEINNEDWTFTITGDVEEEVTLRWGDILDKYEDQAVTDVRTLSCAVNGAGNGLIMNVKVKGIPMSLIMGEVELLQEEGKASAYYIQGIDGMCFPSSDDPTALFVYEINDEPIGAEFGAPFKVWYANGVLGAYYMGWVSTIDVRLVDIPDTVNSGPSGPGEIMYLETVGNGPLLCNCGITNVRDGQVFNMGETVTVEGYAFAFTESIVQLDVSFDLGETWIEVDTSEAEPRTWVYWTCEFTPEATGSYVLEVRALNSEGQWSTSNGILSDKTNICRTLINVE